MITRVLAVAGALTFATLAMAEGPADPAVAESADGIYLDADGSPTFNIAADGTVDWQTFSGFRRYHGECHVCHGPDGEGSTYAPALKDSLKNIDYAAFKETVTNGRQNGTSVMPAFGANPNVNCYLDDLYVYLRARAQGDLARGRPAKREDKSAAYSEAENACMGG